MSIRFTCPTCKKTLSAPDNKAGVRVLCPGCKQALTIPSPSTSKARTSISTGSQHTLDKHPARSASQPPPLPPEEPPAEGQEQITVSPAQFNPRKGIGVTAPPPLPPDQHEEGKGIGATACLVIVGSVAVLLAALVGVPLLILMPNAPESGSSADTRSRVSESVFQGKGEPIAQRQKDIENPARRGEQKEPAKSGKFNRATATRTQFIEKVNDLATEGEIDPSEGLCNAKCDYEDFIEMFGKPYSDVAQGTGRQWIYSCTDGTLVFSVRVVEGEVSILNVNSSAALLQVPNGRLRGNTASGTQARRVREGNSKYKGKILEVTGALKRRGNLLLTLAGGTDNSVELEFHFGVQHEAALRKLPRRRGDVITVRGTCNNGTLTGKYGTIRFDNCELVGSPGQDPSVTVVSAAQLFGDYLGNARNAGSGEEGVVKVEISQFLKEYESDFKGATSKYKNKVVEVEGRVSKISSFDATIVLEAGRTDLRLKVECAFSLDYGKLFKEKAYKDRFGRGQTITIRGRCSGPNGNAVRLDDCLLNESNPAEKPLAVDTTGTKAKPDERPAGGVTAEYLPYKPGTVRVYEVAMFTPKGPIPCIQNRFTHGEDGLIESEVIKTGRLVGKSLLPDGEVDWSKDVQEKAKHPSHYRVADGFVQVGQHLKDDKEVFWEPVLKVGGKAGDTWIWRLPTGDTKRYAIVKVEEYKGHPAALVQTMTTSRGASLVTQHIYLEGVGEVERVATTVRSGISQVISQTRLVPEK